MVNFKKIIMVCFAFIFIACTPTFILKNDKTKVPKDFTAIKIKYQKRKYYPLKELYVIDYNIWGKSNFDINNDSKPWNYHNPYRTFIKFYGDGNVNFFYLNVVSANSFDPEYNGDRGFYYFLDEKNFIIKIYITTDDWGGKSYETYFGYIDGNRILLRTGHNIPGAKSYIIGVYKKSTLNPPDYAADW